MHYSLKQTTAPTEEPITEAEAFAQLRLDEDDGGILVPSMIGSAREMSEEFTRRQLVTATFTMKLDVFPVDTTIDVPKPPLQSVTSIEYVDQNGDTQTLASNKYVVDTNSDPGRITLNSTESWPATNDQIDAVTIIFVAGYGAASAVPFIFKNAIRLMMTHSWENRGEVEVEMPDAIKSLLWMKRIEVLGTQI